jgi:NAD(P)H-quinone oxidoreductase subunit 4
MSLLLLLLVPMLAGLSLPLLPLRRLSLVRPLAAAAALVQLLAGMLCWLEPPDPIRLSWLPRLGLALDLGLDGLSLPLVLLTALITALAVLASPRDQPRPRLFFPLILATNLGVVGAFLARNALLFVLAYELVLIPTTLLVATWGGERRAGAAIRFLLFQALSGVFLLAGVLAFGWFDQAPPATGELGGALGRFGFPELAAARFGDREQIVILLLLLTAFGLKLPVVPLHAWQPITYGQAPTSVVMLLSGVVSKLAAYGLLRFGVQLLPHAWALCAPWLAAAGALSAVYGALNAIVATDIRRLVAFGSLGHMGLLVLALAAATNLSLQGAVAELIAHGLIVSLLFACVGLIERKTGTTAIADLSGLMNPIRGLPFTMGMMLLALMAAAGIPGLAGFPAELLVFLGSWTVFPWATLICLLASGLTAVYAVRLFNRVGFGRLDNSRADWQSTSWGERAPAILLTGLVVLCGIWPTALTGWSESLTARLALQPADRSALMAAAPSPPSEISA